MTDYQLYEDISPQEEAQLPLPQDWIRTILNKNGSNVRIYRNVKTGQELDEHPIIARAMNAAKKLPLPHGWSVQETVNAYGEVERFYYHTDTQLSMWDHPLLRSCVGDYLGVIGVQADDVGFRVNKHVPIIEAPSDTTNHNATDPTSSPSLLDRRLGKKLTLTDLKEDDSPSSPLPRSPSVTGSPSPPHYPMFPQEETPADVHTESKATAKRDWTGLLEEFKEPIRPYEEKVSHRVGTVPPPVTKAGVKILREDVNAANERTHQLVMKLRALLAAKSGYNCTFLYHDNIDEKEEKNVITLASDIVTTLRQQPELVIMAIASNNNTIGSMAMIQTAFVAVHRLLHPFSTDNSMTTALLLQGINFQLEEMAQVEQIFCSPDSRMIIPRALCIYEPVTAVKWNPVDNPMPVVPNVESETVFACLMRMYGIRRDVTAYFRAVWKPVLSSIANLLSNEYQASDPLVLINLITLAYRLLECTFHEKSMTVFPTIATAISRAIYEIGGQEAMLSVIFNFLIIPNMVKIFGGDHDSLENEDCYRVDEVVKVINKYFDHSWWLEGQPKHSKNSNSKTKGQEKEDASILILKNFIWVVWRVFSCSTYLSEASLTAMTAPEFVTQRLGNINCSGLKDYKLRNLLEKTKRKITLGCTWLIKMPLDINGNQYLGVENDNLLDQLSANNETNDLLHRRMTSLSFKPNEMLNATIVSRYELCSFLSDLGCAMDDKDFPFDSPIYRAIADFLSVYANEEEDIHDESREELMQLTFLYTSNHGEGDKIIPGNTQDQLLDEYRQLMLGLKLANRYEDTLINLIRKVNEGVVNNIYELLTDSHWYLEPEFDYDFKVNHVEIAEKKTEGWRGKIKSSQNGLKQPRPVHAFPLFSQHNQVDYHPNIKSMAALQKDVIASYRFGSAQPGVDVGTSFARTTGIRPAKVTPTMIKVTTLQDHPPPGINQKDANKGYDAGSEYSTRSAASSRNGLRRSQFTEATINPKSSILVPTKSFQNARNPDIVTPFDKDKKFMKNMRDYKVIPTEEFQMRYFRRRQASAANRQVQRDHDHSNARRKDHNIAIESFVKAPPPKPFPVHLRHLIRSDGQENTAVDDIDDVIFQYEEFKNHHHQHRQSSQGMPQPHGTSHKKGRKAQGSEEASLNPEFFKSLIQDYQSTIQPIANKAKQDSPEAQQFEAAETKNSANSNFYSQYPLRYRSLGGHNSYATRARSRSPGLPKPLENTNLMSPTQSLLRKLEPEPLSSEFLRDLHENRPPELRKYDDELGVNHEEPFIPTKSKSYPVTGVRAPQVPEFLQPPDEELERTGRSRSRSRSRSGNSTPVSTGSRSRSRSRSRSTSPGTRSRSGSYAKPTQASLQKLSERALQISQAKDPNLSGGIGAPQEVSIPLDDSPRSSLSSSPSKSMRKKPKQISSDEESITERHVHNIVPMNQSEANNTIQPEDSEKTKPKTNVVQVKRMKVKVPRAPTPPSHSKRSESPNGFHGGHGMNLHKYGFAEAAAHALNEAVGQDQDRTTYAMTFSPDYDRHRSVANLQEDREKVFERRKQLLQQKFDDEFDVEGKYLDNKPHRENDKREQLHDSATFDESAGGSHKIPIIKRRSLIKSMNMNKEMFYNGFIAKKHGRSGNPKVKMIKYIEDTQEIGWQNVRRSSITNMFGGKEKDSSKISIFDITEVRKGIQTDILAKAASVDPNCCMSIITKDRSLDLVLETSQDRDTALRGLLALLDANGIHVPFI